MKYSFHPEAESDFIQAIEYYEECELGLGYDFAVEVYLAVERTMTYPKAWPIIEEEIRRFGRPQGVPLQQHQSPPRETTS